MAQVSPGIFVGACCRDERRDERASGGYRGGGGGGARRTAPCLSPSARPVSPTVCVAHLCARNDLGARGFGVRPRGHARAKRQRGPSPATFDAPASLLLPTLSHHSPLPPPRLRRRRPRPGRPEGRGRDPRPERLAHRALLPRGRARVPEGKREWEEWGERDERNTRPSHPSSFRLHPHLFPLSLHWCRSPSTTTRRRTCWPTCPPPWPSSGVPWREAGAAAGGTAPCWCTAMRAAPARPPWRPPTWSRTGG